MRRLWILLPGLWLIACGRSRPAGGPAAVPSRPHGTPVPTLSSPPAPTPALPPGRFSNPVRLTGFPDPDGLLAGGLAYACATGGNGRRVRVTRSDNLIGREVPGEGRPVRAAPEFDRTRAPEVSRLKAFAARPAKLFFNEAEGAPAAPKREL